MELEEKKQYNKGFRRGALISGLSVFAVVFLTAAVLFSLYVQSNAIKNRSILNLDSSATTKINTLLSYIDKYFLYENDETEITEAMYDAILAALGDPYSCYYTAEEYDTMMQSSEGKYCGIGVVVTTDIETGLLMVIEPYEGAPGALAGIEEGDYIVAVDGEDITGLDSGAAAALIKGEEGTTVVVTVQRDGVNFDLEIVRADVEIKSVDSVLLEDNIGYIVISQFDVATITQFETHMYELIDAGMEGLIIDIRDNPGGRLDAVVAMLDLILPEGTIVYTEDKNGNGTTFSSDAATILDVPCAVLINGGSASASEIFAGAMQDYELAEIIGTQSFGKGIVQTIYPLSDGSAIKLTVASYYTPVGANIHGTGIFPNTVVEFDEEVFEEEGIDTQLEAAVEYIRQAISQ